MPTEEQRQRNRASYLKYKPYFLAYSKKRIKERMGEPGSEQRKAFNAGRKKYRDKAQLLHGERLRKMQREKRQRLFAKDPDLARAKARESRRRRLDKIHADPERRARHLAYYRDLGRKHREKHKAENPNWMREMFTLRRYRLTPQAFANLLNSQGGGCAICHATLDFSTKAATPHIDHDHATGEVRGVLCMGCNTGLGVFKDRIDLLSGAIGYLEKAAKCQSKA